MNMVNRRNGRNAFTLIELVVVIMILGILAGVAAPKLLNVSAEATDNGLKQTLAIIRDSIELFAADPANGGALPPCKAPGTNFRTALDPYIRGDFPTCPVGVASVKNADIKPGTGVPLVADNAATGWMYNVTTGEFICNSTSTTASDVSASYDDY